MATLPQLKVALLGGFSLTVDAQLQTAVNQPQQQSLLAYLILQTSTPQLRRTIAFQFWPDSGEKRAFANLRGALHKLRHDCPAIEHYLISTNTTLGWQRPSTFRLDVYEFENCLTQSHQATDPAQLRHWLEQAITTYQGDLLPGCYDEWILRVRERFNQSYLQALQQLVDLLAQVGEVETAVTYAHQLRRSDPFREQSYQRLMTLHEARGDRAAALRVYHDCVTMLEQELGVSPGPETQVIYNRILNRTTPLVPATPLPVATGDKVIGREAEWQTLQAAWHKASQGQPRLVLIQGEAGIGKTHLAETLLIWARQHGQLTVQTRAYAAEGQLTYSPIIDWLRSPIYASVLTTLDDVWLTECARLLPELLIARPDLPAPPPVSESWQRQRLFEALARAALTLQKPLLILFDDLQWADKETLEWLHFLLRFEATFPLMLVGTVRLSEVAADHPFTALKQQLHRDGRIQEITLAPLTATASNELAQQIVGSQLSVKTLANLYRYAEGVPLFLVETVRAEMDKPEAERWRWPTTAPISAANTLPLPTKVYAVIQARLNQLSPGARQLVNVAAVVGRAFSLELLTLASHSDEASLVKNLDELWQRRIIREQGTYYDLHHDRIRDVVYAEIPPMQRKLLHRQVAEALVQRYATNFDGISAQLAHHYEAADLISQAVDCYLQAGEVAQQIYAHDHAYDLFSRGLAILEKLPPTVQRDRQELSLCGALTVSVQVIKGWAAPETYYIAQRAWKLSIQLNDLQQRFILFVSMYAYHAVQGDLDQGQQVAEQALVIAEQEQNPSFLASAHNILAGVNICRGNFRLSYTHFEKSLNYCKPQQQKVHVLPNLPDSGTSSLVWIAHPLWFLGYPDQALERCGAGLELAQVLNDPYSQVFALAYAIKLHHFRRETDQIAVRAEACRAVASRYNIGYYLQWAMIFLNWLQAERHPGSVELTNLQAALDDFRASGARLRLPYYLSLLADAYERAGQPSKGLTVIDEALAIALAQGERWWNAELYRLRGNFLNLQGAETTQVEAAYQQALLIARQQEARSLELRAAMSLARLWQGQGRGAEAHGVLTAIYDQFTEGFDTPDLQDAQTLLTNLTK